MFEASHAINATTGTCNYDNIIVVTCTMIIINLACSTAFMFYSFHVRRNSCLGVWGGAPGKQGNLGAAVFPWRPVVLP